MSQFSCPEFTKLPPEVMKEFLDHLEDNCDDIRSAISDVDFARNPIEQLDKIRDLFGAIHTLKGNCAMVLLNPIVMVIHELEESITQLREEKFAYDSSFGKLISGSLDVLKGVISTLNVKGQAESTQLHNLYTHLKRVKESQSADKLLAIKNAIWIIDQEQTESNLPTTIGKKESSGESSAQSDTLPVSEDLKFFRRLASQLDELSNFRDNRTYQVFLLASKLNEEMNHIVDPKQLEMAVYMHDVGMAFVPHNILNNQSALTGDDLARMQQHVYVGAGLIKRMDEWKEAAEMIYQHHEKYDGSGYPNQLSGQQIVPGAKIIGIADAFYSMIHERSDRSYKRSVMDAVKEINTLSGTQFSPSVVQAFNKVIRHDFLHK